VLFLADLLQMRRKKSSQQLAISISVGIVPLRLAPKSMKIEMLAFALDWTGKAKIDFRSIACVSCRREAEFAKQG
jgi:hypothetical protein